MNHSPHKTEHNFFYLCSALVIFLGFTFTQHSLALTEPLQSQEISLSEITLSEVKGGQLLFKTDKPGRYIPSVLMESEVHFNVSGIINHTTLIQSFHNDSQDWVEGIYVFPLPEQAAVNKMRIQIGERIIEGSVHEKKKAKKIYQQAKASGKKASLVEQERPNMFTNSVANIGPGETVKVEIHYIEQVQCDSGIFSLRFPMTITPRYIPGNPQAPKNLPAKSPEESEQALTINSDSGWGWGWSHNTDQVPDASRITPFLNPIAATQANPIHPIKISAEINGGLPLQSVDSAYHNIVTSRHKNQYSIKLPSGTVPMNQDFVLSWKPMTGQEPEAALFSETIEGEHYSLLMLLPPQHSTQVKTLPKEMIFIVDTSGSMDGVSIKQARQSLLMALDTLNPGDRFNIIEFNSVTKPFYPSAIEASRQNVSSAKGRVQQLQSGGGTEMYPALETALQQTQSESHIRQVIFITDGAVGNEEALFKLIHKKLGNSRLFTVGIGSAPNSHFMRKAAQFGRGTFTHIGEIQEVQEKMSALFSKLDNPVTRNIEVQWPANTDVEMYPKRVQDLYQGQPIFLAAKTGSLNGTLEIKGLSADKTWQRTFKLDKKANQKGVSTFWARQKIADLMDQKTEGRDEAEVREEVIDVALTHQLVSAFTSFVAVEKTPSRPAHENLKSKPVANLRPKGQGPQHYAYPRTATTSLQNILLGLTLLLMGFFYQHFSRLSPYSGKTQTNLSA